MSVKAIRAIAALLCAAVAIPAHAEAPEKPKLVVTLVVDQYAADLFAQYRDTYTAGLARLADGIVFENGYQSHAATETCPGHSTILTGRHPSATGIIGNYWYDRTQGLSVYCAAVPGLSNKSQGPQALRVDTLGTWLKASEPQAQVVSVSGKDRAAIMLGGHHADVIYWWNDGDGFASSPWAEADPIGALPQPLAYDRALMQRWRASPPQLWPTEVPARCAALERPEQFGRLHFSGKLPPDGASEWNGDPSDWNFARHLRASPLFDRLTLEFAEQVISARNLGHGDATDLVAVSLSATDYVGHAYGKGGPEMCLQMQALDQALGQFLGYLDGLDTPYVVVLTADHGSSDTTERVARNGVEAGRIDRIAFIKRLNDHLRETLGLEASPIAGYDPQDMTITIYDDPALYQRVSEEAVRWLRTQPHVHEVLTRAEVAAAAPPPGKSPAALTVAERFNESFDAARSGDIFVVFDAQFRTLTPRFPGDAVAGHGTPWDYDRKVPILFWWPGVTHAEIEKPVETVDIAPTLANMLGVRTPMLDGHCLAEVSTCAYP